MKKALFFISVLVTTNAFAQTAKPIESDVYAWGDLRVEKKQTSERRAILEGSGPILANLEIHATTVDPGKAPHAPHKHPEEELIIVKEGTVNVTINNTSKILGPGSVAVFLPGDMHGLVNAGDTKATYYVLRYSSADSADHKRGADAGGSFMIKRDDIPFTPHAKGGVRQYFERPTTMAHRFEMHATTLNAGLKSHDPHTHKALEIMIMIEGNGEMQIGQSTKKVTTGDLVYLESNVLHAILNNDTKACTYLAIQLQ